MLNLAKGLCAMVLPDLTDSTISSPSSAGAVEHCHTDTSNVFAPITGPDTSFIFTNGDFEMWMKLCSEKNRQLVRVYRISVDPSSNKGPICWRRWPRSTTPTTGARRPRTSTRPPARSGTRTRTFEPASLRITTSRPAWTRHPLARSQTRHSMTWLRTSSKCPSATAPSCRERTSWCGTIRAPRHGPNRRHAGVVVAGRNQRRHVGLQLPRSQQSVGPPIAALLQRVPALAVNSRGTSRAWTRVGHWGGRTLATFTLLAGLVGCGSR